MKQNKLRLVGGRSANSIGCRCHFLYQFGEAIYVAFTGVFILDIKLPLKFQPLKKKKLNIIDDDVIIGFIFQNPFLGGQSLEGGGGRSHWGLNPRTLICRQIFLSLSYRPIGTSILQNITIQSFI